MAARCCCYCLLLRCSVLYALYTCMRAAVSAACFDSIVVKRVMRAAVTAACFTIQCYLLLLKYSKSTASPYVYKKKRAMYFTTISDRIIIDPRVRPLYFELGNC